MPFPCPPSLWRLRVGSMISRKSRQSKHVVMINQRCVAEMQQYTAAWTWTWTKINQKIKGHSKTLKTGSKGLHFSWNISKGQSGIKSHFLLWGLRLMQQTYSMSVSHQVFCLNIFHNSHPVLQWGHTDFLIWWRTQGDFLSSLNMNTISLKGYTAQLN